MSAGAAGGALPSPSDAALKLASSIRVVVVGTPGAWGVVEGLVVDAVTKRPIEGALVGVRGLRPSRAQAEALSPVAPAWFAGSNVDPDAHRVG
jgi:hypothetical protein